MILFFSAGQLGNQIFQYTYLGEIRKPNEFIITSWCEFFDVFEIPIENYIFFNKYFRFVLRRVFSLLAKCRIISQLKQKRYLDGQGNEIFEACSEFKPGVLAWIKYVEGFFQSEQFFKFENIPVVKQEFVVRAKNFLEQIPTESMKVFVHIRRGDYLDWNILGDVNPSLPQEYYEKIARKISENNELVTFIFLSNDVTFVESHFAHVKNKMISRNDVSIDFAIMSLCDGGILSNSTLSWWAGSSMRPGSMIYAPKYWLGWKREVWYPRGIETDKFKYIEVKS